MDTSQQVLPVTTSQPTLVVLPEKKMSNKKLVVLIGILLLIVIGQGGYILFSQSKLTKQETVVVSSSSLPIIPTINMPVKSTVDVVMYNSWQTVEDGMFKLAFKIPSNQRYSEGTKTITPAGIRISVDAHYDGGSKREYIKKQYKLTNSDISVEEYTTITNIPALLIQVRPTSYISDNFDYIGLMTKGKNMYIFNGKKENKALIIGVLDTLEITGSFSYEKDIFLCNNFTKEPKDSAGQLLTSGKLANGDYYHDMYFTQKIDTTHMKNSGALKVEVHPAMTDIYKLVEYTLIKMSDVQAPFVEKIRIAFTKDDVIKAVGEDLFNKSTEGIGISRGYQNLKTIDGLYCNETSSIITNPIK